MVAPPKTLRVAVPEFTEAGVLLAITYSIREGRRGEFFDLMRELKPLLHTIGEPTWRSTRIAAGRTT